MTNDTDGYLDTKILSPTYGLGESPRISTGTLILKFIESYLRGGQMTNDTDGYLVTKILKS